MPEGQCQQKGGADEAVTRLLRGLSGDATRAKNVSAQILLHFRQSYMNPTGFAHRRKYVCSRSQPCGVNKIVPYTQAQPLDKCDTGLTVSAKCLLRDRPLLSSVSCPRVARPTLGCLKSTPPPPAQATTTITTTTATTAAPHKSWLPRSVETPAGVAIPRPDSSGEGRQAPLLLLVVGKGRAQLKAALSLAVCEEQ
eukprot:scaffold31992_cov19-Tisochrysis_lutea.AAC.1